jgi:para-nitrobenzyl esterase
VLQLDAGPALADDDGVYKGIPYAAPPVGTLRWRPPQPVAPWTEPRRFDAFGPACPQPEADGETSEDCLTLNVWTPARTADAKFPVMVFIHGGSFLTGSGSLPVYDGAPLAEAGVVVVTLNYRLGVLGFLAHPQLSAQSPQGVSGNYGLLDQQAALAWVRRNIAAFGGDPANVTVFGQSAGAASIVLQLVSPKAGALFDRAIVQSPVGPGSLRPLKTPEQGVVPAEALGRLFARKLGAPPSGDELAFLRAADAKAVLAASALDPGLSLEVAGLVFGPVIDGVVVPGRPVDLVQAGRQHKKPLVVGTTANEASLFLPGLSPPVDTPQAYRHFVENRFGPEAATALALLPGDKADLWRDLDRLLTVRWFETYAAFLARNWAVSGTPCWLYRLTKAPPDGALDLLADEADAAGVTPQMAGVPHSADIFSVFGYTPWYLGFGGADRAFSRTVRAYWTSFAKAGDPNGPGLPSWPGYAPDAPALLELGPTVAPRPAPGDPLYPLVEACWRTTLY